jgi:hypothetical protein
VAVLIGKFDLESNLVTFTGIVVLVVASAWNIWPLPAVDSCSCNSKSDTVSNLPIRTEI